MSDPLRASRGIMLAVVLSLVIFWIPVIIICLVGEYL